MKTIVTIALAMIMAVSASAQMFSTTEGKTFTYKESNLEDKKEETSTVTIKSVTKADDGVLTINMEEKEMAPFGEFITHMSATYNPATDITTYNVMTAEEFQNSMMEVLRQMVVASGQYPTDKDMEELRAQMQMSGGLVIPLNPAAEAATPFDKSTVRCLLGGMQKLSLAISKGVYEGTETVETPAGKFDCLKLSYQMKTAMGGPVENHQITEWYAKGTGLVKQVTTDKKGKVLKETLLESISD